MKKQVRVCAITWRFIGGRMARGGIRVGLRDHLYWVAASQKSQQPDTRSASYIYHGSTYQRLSIPESVNASKRAPLPSSKLGDISHLSMDRGILDINCAGLPSYESIAHFTHRTQF